MNNMKSLEFTFKLEITKRFIFFVLGLIIGYILGEVLFRL